MATYAVFVAQGLKASGYLFLHQKAHHGRRAAGQRWRLIKKTHGIGHAERAEAVAAFQDGRIRVVLLTLGAGSEGITLARANTICFARRSWMPLESEQAEGRIYGIGSDRHDVIRVIEQITPGPVQEAKRKLLEGKEERVEEILRDKDALRKLIGG